MKQKIAMIYAIVRFQPFVETEEFANVGVILVAPEIGYFDFRVETRKNARVSGFFDNLDTITLKSSLKSLEVELERIKKLAGHMPNGQKRFDLWKDQDALYLFKSLTKNREGNIRFSDHRYVFDNSPEEKIRDLFGYYVQRNFVNHVYKEALLEKAVGGYLRANFINSKFIRKEFTDGLYTAKFPFVFSEGKNVTKVIKPLHLAQSDPSKILEHGNKWLFTVNRLRKVLPDSILFVVDGPDNGDRHKKAFEETKAEMKRNSIEVASAKNFEKIRQFAVN
jgi:Protein of unknown function (DUF3037)